jgi:hypothetical protein
MLKLSRKLRCEFAALVDREVAATLAGHRAEPAAQNRFEAIGMTLSSALPAAVEAWRPVAGTLGVRARLVGAFSLGAPRVEFTDRAGRARTSALADLMILVDDLRPQEQGRSAMLVRTVEAGAGGTERDDGMRVAPELYDAWPAFRFQGAPGASVMRRLGQHSPSAAPEDSTRLAAIDLRPGSEGWAYRGPRGTRVSFGALLAAMATGSAGRPAVRGGEDDWSLMIDQLIRRTASATLKGLSAPEADLRSAETFSGESGTGYVLFESRTGYCGTAAELTSQDGPVSVAHLVFD